MELREGDRLEGSDDTPMYNPHILPLKKLELGIVEIVNDFQNKSSCDVNGISIRFIKIIIYSISLLLTYFLNLCVEKGIFPNSKTRKFGDQGSILE